MAFGRNAFQRLGPANSNAPSLFSYGSAGDAVATVDGSGYFNDAAGDLKVGDAIYVKPTSGTPGWLWVVSNTRDLAAAPPVEGVVDTSNTLALSAIDSD
jgi:hypothetical protein